MADHDILIGGGGIRSLCGDALIQKNCFEHPFSDLIGGTAEATLYLGHGPFEE